ncbi:MAG: hypothetical protein D6701_12990 [Gemmatimonadetes bacterium]|nr:MAG: hypothetical protein D6701_12990 [Gemmatimonadota bacterium]
MGFPAPLHAQAGADGSAVETDGPLLEPGRLRFSIRALFESADHVFGADGREALGARFSADPLGASVVPALQRAEEGLRRALPGESVAPFTLGVSDVVITQSALRVPLRVDVGVFDWLSVGGTAPFVRRRAEVQSAYRPDSANVGLTPIVSDPADVSDFLNSMEVAVFQLRQRVEDACAAQAPDCSSGTALLAESQDFLTGMRDAYLGQGVFPLAGSSLGDAILARAGTLDARFRAFGVNTFPTAPPLATEPLGDGFFDDLVTSPALGIGAAPLATWTSGFELGDVELFANARVARWRWADSAGAEGASLELGGGLLIRLPTGTQDDPDNLVDRGSGDGQLDVEGRLFANFRARGPWGVWADVRYTRQQEGDRTMRVAPPEAALPEASSRQRVRWAPGDQVFLRVTPRVALTREVTLALDLTHWSRGADQLTLPAGAPPGLDRSAAVRGTDASATTAGLGLVYSTLPRWRAGASVRPVEFRFQIFWDAAGSGVHTLDRTGVQFGVRLVRDIF